MKTNESEFCEALLYDIAEVMQVEVSDIRSRSRKREHVAARTFYCFIARKTLDERYPFKAIGKHINRDHSTVLHSFSVMSSRDPERWFWEQREQWRVLKEKYIAKPVIVPEFNAEVYIRRYLTNFAKQHVKWTDSHEELVLRYMSDNPVIF